jgi:hypothetical protein
MHIRQKSISSGFAIAVILFQLGGTGLSIGQADAGERGVSRFTDIRSSFHGPAGPDAALKAAMAPQTASNCHNPSFSYNVLCFGADPTGGADSAKAMQAALDIAHGAPVEIPAGKYLLLKPLVIEAGDDSPGPRIEGAGQDVTLLEPCFTGTTQAPARGAVIAVDGSRLKGASYPYKFANGGYIRGLSIDGAAAWKARVSAHASGVCPNAAGAGLDGIQITSWWQAEIEDVRIQNMGKDAIDFPWRRDLFDSAGCPSPDCFASAHNEIKHARLIGNYGWGVDGAAGIGFTYNGVTESVIEDNAAGGIYLFGWQNWIVNNSIAANGCSVSGQPAGGGCTLSQPNGASSPQPGGGVLLARFNPGPDEPKVWESVLGARIERNEFDSNYGYDIWQQAGDNVQILENRFLNHAAGIWVTGKQGNYPHCQVVLGYGAAGSGYVVRNTYLRGNLSRSDSPYRNAMDYETQMYCVDPHAVAQTEEQQETTFGPNTFNFSVLVAGGGASGVCSQTQGKITRCTVQSGGWYPVGASPRVKIVGPGCAGQVASATMAASGTRTWIWVTGIQINNGGVGCRGDVWPVFASIPYPMLNKMGNRFQGYQPRTATSLSAGYTAFTAPAGAP